MQHNVSGLGGKKSQLGDVYSLLCQGPNVIVGCADRDGFQALWHSLNGTTGCLFTSCFYQGKILNHLDVEILLRTDKSIYSTLLQRLDKKTEIYSVLRDACRLHPLLQLQHNLLTVFRLYGESLTP
jgi:hypothetical protein